MQQVIYLSALHVSLSAVSCFAITVSVSAKISSSYREESQISAVKYEVVYFCSYKVQMMTGGERSSALQSSRGPGCWRLCCLPHFCPMLGYQHPAGRQIKGRRCEARAEVREEGRCHAAGFQVGGSGHKPRNVGLSRSWKDLGTNFPLELGLGEECITFPIYRTLR
jgi:hypothetical protein